MSDERDTYELEGTLANARYWHKRAEEAEAQNRALQERLDHEHANRMTLLANHTALQEENEQLKGLDEHAEWERAELWREKANNLDRITRALQARIEELTKGVQAINDLNVSQATAWEVLTQAMDITDQLLSPTQETPFVGTVDEAIAWLKEPDQDDPSPPQDVIDARAVEDHWPQTGETTSNRYRPTQETDPE